ncbi:hypothetical protein ACP70R_006746 [Stipagrostis hirtigluma subsp. patula]
MGRPSLEALAMASADHWAEVRAGDDDGGEEAAPPEHLRAFEAFLEAVVPVDMLLAFGRDAHRRRGHEEDVKAKLRLWAKAVASKTRQGMKRNKACVCRV